jgi:hypothetical protein|tara:strand:+ start:8404 stop:8625 length:222 start_codon:yes stop_codon:yes gene_type:complete
MVFDKIVNIFGFQGSKLLAKITLVIAALALFGVPEVLLEFLNESYFGLDFLTGNAILGVLLLFWAWMMHKNHI